MRFVAVKLFLLFTIYFLPAQSLAHSGRTDSSGGHNCNVGACAGTYHYHNGGSSYTPSSMYEPVVTYKNVSEDATIAYETIEQYDADMDVGQREIKQIGVNGVKTNSYRITYRDGVQTNKELISSSITKPPTNEIVSIGTRQQTASVNSSYSNGNSEPESSSPGEVLTGLAVMVGAGYSLLRLNKHRISKINKNEY